MSLDKHWFSEIHHDVHSAFSYKIKRKLLDEKTPFQHLEVFETEGFGNLMTLDGCIMLTTRDNFIYHEMITHPALFTHPEPKKVMIIGGGDCGTLKEVLKHKNVEEAHQIEIDEAVTRAAEKFFPELCTSNNDPRAKLMFIDGIKWVHDTKPNTYDIIIIDSTDPVGPAEGLFSKQFYQECLRILKPNGIVIQQSESPLYHIHILRDMYKAIRGAGFVDVMTMFFPQCSYPSGWWSTTMACKDSTLSSFRETDAGHKDFATKYYNAAIHRAAMAAPEFFYAEIEK